MQPGFYTSDQLPAADYHSGDGVSNSGLKLIGERTPAHFWHQYLNPDRREEIRSSAPMFIGTAMHAAALEPSVFRETYVLAPFEARNSAGYKAWANQQSKLILMPGDYQNVLGMRRSIFMHPMAGSLLTGPGHFEYSAYAIDRETGVLLKIRMDRLTDSGWIVDLKKTQDASDEGCAKAIERYGYFHQCAFYKDVLTTAAGDCPRGFAFIFVEEAPPHAVNVVMLVPEDEERGRRLYRRNLSIYARCLRDDQWPAYGNGYSIIGMSSWARRRIDTLIHSE